MRYGMRFIFSALLVAGVAIALPGPAMAQCAA